MVLNCDAGASTVYGHMPTRVGAGYKLEKTDFLRARIDLGEEDVRWFRPADVGVAPDGSVLVADWYDPGVGGHAAGDKKAYGRILRVIPARGTKKELPMTTALM